MVQDLNHFLMTCEWEGSVRFQSTNLNMCVRVLGNHVCGTQY